MSINQITAAVSSVANIAAIAPAADARVAIKATTDSKKVNQTDASNEKGDAVSDAELKKSVDAINRFFNANNSVNLNLDSESGKVIVQIVDKETNTLIRQIPSKEVLEMAKDLEKKNGMLLRDQA
ncbi:flagellar protein FlaG [Undibacterium seohonense]|jgi:flagellar protein FlaG|uniref:Flagellar protein FlaG n=1 Tax=Undibacterium seohonense TaxID=1344950 RepID=A0ABR6X7Z7_9BURK|nr:flagellar protein FlaG [Undibacterium seohonense]MBC3808935.1 flagellar protein FlaG [Undibacterium seohonense]